MTNPIDTFLVQFFSALLLLFTGLRLLLSDWIHLWDVFLGWRASLKQENARANIQEIINVLRRERDRIDAAIIALEGLGARGKRRSAQNRASPNDQRRVR